MAVRLLLICLLALPAAARSTHFVTVNGVKLHYLDWGGRGETILMLAGFGVDAHSFETFAPKFVDAYRVLALTRRGFGPSDKPPRGYDLATRVEDIRRFLDALKIERVHLVGHSMAGDELTLFATRYPKRVRTLVYLEAAYDRSGMRKEQLSDPSLPPMWKRLALEVIGSPQAASVAVPRLPPPDLWRAMVEVSKAADTFHPDYRPIAAPALAFYARLETHPGAARERDPARRREMNAWWTKHAVPHFRASVEQFRREIRRGEVVVIPGADHFIFTGKTEEQVVRRMRVFLAQ